VRPGRWRGVALLAAAIACEVGGTFLLRESRGFTAVLPSLGVVGGYCVSIVLFSRALAHELTLGVAYGILIGCGLAAATLLGALLGEPLSALQACGLVLVLVGALVLQRDPGGTRP
jgi:small multidrug resistance pump